MHRLTQFSLAYPKITLTILIAITALLGTGLGKVRTEFGYRVLLGDEHPSVQALDSLIQEFGGGLPVQIVWKCGVGQPCESVFDENSLLMADGIARLLALRSDVQQVRGASNAPLLVATPQGFSVRYLIENGKVAEDVDDLAELVLEDPIWRDTFVSSDREAGIIFVQPTDNAAETSVQIVAAIEDALRPYEKAGFRFSLVGAPVATVVAGRDLSESTARLTPFTVLVVGFVLILMTRSWQLSLSALATMGLALLWTLGFLGHLDWPRDGILEVLPSLILAIGVCDAVHLLAAYAGSLPDEPRPTRTQRSQALLASATRVAGPCLLTTLTTCAAFLSFLTSALDTFVRFGVTAAFGVASCLFLTFCLLPIIVRNLPSRNSASNQASKTWTAFLEAVVRTTERRAKPILLVAGVVVAVSLVGWIGLLRVDTDWYETFGEHSRVVRWLRFVETHVRPAGTLEILVQLPPPSTVAEPLVIDGISALSDYASSLEGLGKSTSVADIIAHADQLLRKGEREKPSATANAELLELVTFSDEAVLSNWVSLDRSKARISVAAPWMSYKKTGQTLRVLQEYLNSQLPEPWGVLLTGSFVIDHDWVRDVQATQLLSFPTALALVFLMVAAFLRSIPLALAALVPTVAPVIVTLGAMGFAGMSLDVGRAMIAAVLLGVSVDDSIHLLAYYQLRRSRGSSRHEAIREAVRRVGRAVVTTSFALSLGFLTLMASAWQTLSSFGFFLAIAILGALGAALFVLPSMFFVGSGRPTS